MSNPNGATRAPLTAHIEVNLNDGLTASEVEALLDRAMAEGKPVGQLIEEAIRSMLARERRQAVERLAR